MFLYWPRIDSRSGVLARGPTGLGPIQLTSNLYQGQYRNNQLITLYYGKPTSISCWYSKKHIIWFWYKRKLHRITNDLLFGYIHVCSHVHRFTGSHVHIFWRCSRGHDRMIVRFVINLLNYLLNYCQSTLRLWVQIPHMARCTTLCETVCQWLATGW